MPQHIDPRREDNPSTYVNAEADGNAEMIRLMIQDQHATREMGGPLTEQTNLTACKRLLDVACGPGGWLIETAVAHRQIQELVGIDLSWRMIEYAQAQAKAQRVDRRTRWLVMDALQPLSFPDASFDLVNTRFSSSYLAVEGWPRFLGELVRVTRQGGVVRVTEGELVTQSSSPALMRFLQMARCAGYKGGYSLSSERWGVTEKLEQWLTECGCQQVQSRTYAFEHKAGTVETQYLGQNMLYGLQNTLPFLRKWDCLREDYESVSEQALLEVQQDDFHAQGEVVTAWGIKPLAGA
jgi:ubiquinone/menaquinone biosynthesis C-methylase UbiE